MQTASLLRIRVRVRVQRPPTALLAVCGWAALVVAGHAIGVALVADDARVRIGAPPVVGNFDVRLSLRVVPAVLLAVAAVVHGPRLAQRLSWRKLLVACLTCAVLWPVALAAGDGLGALPAPLETRYEYLADVPRVGDRGEFLRTFTDDLPDYRTHVKAHPPGLLLVLSELDAASLGGGVVALLLVLGVGALAAPAALVAFRELAGERRARAAAPFVVFAPAAVWIATSADALFAGVAAVGIAAFTVATGRVGARRHLLALAAGLVLGCGLFLSYGIVPLGIAVVLVAAHRRAADCVLVAGVGVAAIALAFLLAGFWWWDGLQATREAYDAGISQLRPHGPFAVISLAAFALVLGPAAVAGGTRLRGRADLLLPVAASIAVSAAVISGLSRGETERIWLPFAPWLLLMCAALPHPRRWLAAQVALALALQLGILTPW